MIGLVDVLHLSCKTSMCKEMWCDIFQHFLSELSSIFKMRRFRCSYGKWTASCSNAPLFYFWQRWIFRKTLFRSLLAPCERKSRTVLLQMIPCQCKHSINVMGLTGNFSTQVFYFKCAKHPAAAKEDRCVPLHLIRSNTRDIPCLACTEVKWVHGYKQG